MSSAAPIQAPAVSPIETFILDRICRPLLPHIPESVTPNMLSWAGHIVAWASFTLAASSSFLSRDQGLWTLVLAGFGLFAQMVLDNLDGMHARATGQTSKFGEFLDHWLDALNVPLTSAAIAMALVVGPSLLVGVQLTAALVYNAQLVTYRRFGAFVHPPTSGTVAQFFLALAFVLLGPYFYLFPRELGFNQHAILFITLLSIAMHLRQCWYYWSHLKAGVAQQLPFLVLAGLFGALHVAGLIGWMEYVLFSVFSSFRITGSCVLNTVLQRDRYDSMDFGVLAGQGLLYFSVTRMAESSVAGLPLPQLVTYGLLAYMLTRNVLELVRAYPEFRPRVTEQAARARID